MGGVVAYRALVVEDELDLAGVLSAYLERGGFDVLQVHDGRSAVAEARRSEPDLLVLDLGLPLLDGVEVCRSVREFSDCYVIMLTARAEEADKLTGLAVGADDYMTKPFSPRELVARAQAMLRRPRRVDPEGPGPQPLRIGDLELDLRGRQVTVGDAAVELTPTELAILTVLASAPSRAFSRRALIHEVWGPSWVGDEHTLDVHVRNLRRKLGDSAQDSRFVLTVRGVGYRCGPGT
jgi:DNA-binding response OmpR family regulator